MFRFLGFHCTILFWVSLLPLQPFQVCHSPTPYTPWSPVTLKFSHSHAHFLHMAENHCDEFADTMTLRFTPPAFTFSWALAPIAIYLLSISLWAFLRLRQNSSFPKTCFLSNTSKLVLFCFCLCCLCCLFHQKCPSHFFVLWTSTHFSGFS